jgi:chemotaxis protein methyltransferase CheR
MSSIDPVHRHLFMEGIFLRYGYDFRHYSEASINRRLGSVLTKFKTSSLLEVLTMVLDSAETFREILPLMTVNTTDFFRDPSFFRAVRETVVPLLKTYPSIRVWSAGCSSGEEIISLAILLEEEGLLGRTTIHATDISPRMIKRAKEGIYDLTALQNFAKNYTAALGKRTPSEYYTADYGLVRFNPRLLEQVVFSEHNLVTDSAFLEAHFICCRNVLIYFNRELQDRVLHLFRTSLIHRGFLGIGNKETMRYSSVHRYFRQVDSVENIFQAIEPGRVAG